MNRHAGSIPELSQEEWADLFEIMKKFENAAKKAFGATSINWTCLMNHAYKLKPYNPHVHWHPRPRYAQPIEFSGETFTDEKFGRHYEAIDANRKLSDEFRKAIESELLKYLR
ncbi:MAG: HIT family protein [Candidatus Micrarchaeota archaeon]|nr:HIT family protein [Candidatus Micrarchaeota archaeon]